MRKVGDWQLDEYESTLTRGKTTKHLTPRSMSVLVALVDNCGQVVTSEELQTRFWPNPYSAEHGLHKAISEIRTALGDDPKSPRYIKTYARRGYSCIPQDDDQAAGVATFAIARVASQAEGARRTSWPILKMAVIGSLGILGFAYWYSQDSWLVTKGPDAVAVMNQQRASIAVLPFMNMTNDEGKEYFADGLTENITYGLSTVPELQVKARTSSFFFKDKDFTVREIGEMLDASHVLEGSIAVSGTDVRVTAQLITTDDAVNVWSARYDRRLADLFSVQDEITQDIVNALDLKLSPRQLRPPANTSSEGYNARLQAQFFMSRLDFDRAKALYEVAVQYDPDDAIAHGALANLHGLDVWFHKATIAQKLPKITSEYQQALSIDPDETTAQAVRLVIEFYVYRNYQSAIDEISALLEKHPDDSTLLGTYRGFMITIGRADLALAALDRALSNNPFGGDTHRVRGETLEHMGRYDEAREAYLRAGELGMDMSRELGYLILSTGDVEAIRGLHDSMEAVFGPEEVRVIFLKALIAKKIDDKATYGLNVRKLLSMELYETHDSHRENVAKLAGDYTTASVARMKRLSENFPVYWSVLGSHSERRDHPELYTNSHYRQLLTDVGLEKKSVEKIVVPDLSL